MIRIRMGETNEATLNGHVWTCEVKSIEKILNWQTRFRSARYERNPQQAIVDHIIDVFPNIKIEILEDTGRDETFDDENNDENIPKHDLDWLSY